MKRSSFGRFVCRVLVAVLVPALVTVPIPVAADTGEAGPGKPAPRPPAVKANRTLPKVTPPSLMPVFSASPTKDELFRARVFEEPLVPLGADSAAENAALATALTAHLKRRQTEDFGAIEAFLREHPGSAWRASLLVNLGLAYRRTAFLSKALAAWEAALTLSEGAPDESGQAVADRSIGELMDLNLDLGRTDALKQLFSRIEGRDVRGSAAEKVAAARQGLWILLHQHQDAVASGPLALDRIMALGRSEHRTHPKVAAFHATPEGATLVEMKSLADEVGLRTQMAFRERGAALVLPAMVHFKLGHFAAALKEEGGRILVHDPILADGDSGELWISRAVVDEETSGFALVREGSLPSGWRAATTTEAAAIRGKCRPPELEPEDLEEEDEECDGMAQYGFRTFLASLFIRDTPVGYTPPRGPAVRFSLTYNQRDASQPQTFSYSNVGRKWSLNWVPYVVDTPGTPQAGAALHLGTGGRRTYSGYGSTPGGFAPHRRTRSILGLASASPLRYELSLSDGSVEVYAQPDGASTFPRRVFLTERIDPQGNKLTFTYDGTFRLVAVTDAINQVTQLFYELPSDPLKVTRVTDPFGRSALLDYDGQGRLRSITDVIGLVSQFTYGAGDFIVAMTTPYGTTTFSKGETNWDDAADAGSRWLEATDPLGGKERLEYLYYASRAGVPRTLTSGAVPVGFAPYNGWLDLKNTFYWDKRAMALHPGDHNKARMINWLRSADRTKITRTKASEKNALESRVWYAYPDQAYVDQEGSSVFPSRVARVLDDSTTQEREFSYNGRGAVIRYVDPVGRETRNTYGTASTPDLDQSTGAGVDLLKIEQKNPTSPTGYDLLVSYVYNAQHRPLTITDTSGQTTTLEYLSDGRPARVVRPARSGLSEDQLATVYSYYPDDAPLGAGHLQAVTGPLTPQGRPTAGFTYDEYGRVRTERDQTGFAFTYDYDLLDRPTRTTFPDETYRETVYNRLDPEAERDRLGRWSYRFHDALRRVVATRDPLGRTAVQEWCGCGSLDKVVDGQNNATTWEYDLQGRPTRLIRPDNAAWEYTYESTTNRLKQRKDPKGQLTNYAYFVDGSLRQTTYANVEQPTPGLSITYDPHHLRPRTRTDGTGTTTYSYHPITVPPALGAGRLAAVDGPYANDVVAYTYNEWGGLASRGLTGHTSTLTYDLLGRLVTKTTPVGPFTYTYDGPTLRPATLTYPNGQVTRYTYFPVSGDQRMQAIEHLDPGGAPLSSFAYTYNHESSIETQTRRIGAGTATVYEYAYDRADQLVAATLKTVDPTPSILKRHGYVYDLAGNRVSEQVDDAVTSWTPNSRNQLTSRQAGGTLLFRGTMNEPATVTVGGQPAQVTPDNRFEGRALVVGGANSVAVTATDARNNTRTNTYGVEVSGTGTTYSYDANGNLTGDGTRTFEYDSESRLTRVLNDTSEVARFTYDGLNRRAQKIAGGITTTFVYEGKEVTEERSSAGSVLRYFHGARVDQPWAVQDETGAVRYFLTDLLGSIVQVTNTTGQVVHSRDYDPWGNPTAGASQSGPAFTGRDWDAETGLYYYRARYYDPKLGRFLSEDPIGFAGGDLNLYAYVFNAPPNWIDPTGEAAAVLAVFIFSGPAGWVVGGVLLLAIGLAAYQGFTYSKSQRADPTDPYADQRYDDFAKACKPKTPKQKALDAERPPNNADPDATLESIEAQRATQLKGGKEIIAGTGKAKQRAAQNQPKSSSESNEDP